MRPKLQLQVLNSVKTSSNEGGFAIPIAIGMGLILIVMATTAIVRSQGDRVASINTKDASRSLLAAEAGISQIQSFMNQYRTVASYPACSLDEGAANCDAVSWATGLPNISNLNAVCSTEADIAAARATVQSWATTSWRAVDPTETETDPTRRKGQFRLVSYRNGTLIVEGRVNEGQSNESVSQLKVNVPIFNSEVEQTAPIWVTHSISGNPVIKGDVLGACDNTFAVSVPAGTDYKAIPTRLPRPIPAAAPTTVVVPAGGGGSTIANTEYYQLDNISSIPCPDGPDDADSVPSTADCTASVLRELPRTTAKGSAYDDKPGADGWYRYWVTSFDESIKIAPGASVRLWVVGNLNLSNKKIVNQCGTDTTCTPFHARVYGINADGTPASTGTLTLDADSRICDVFFHMPNYNVSSTSSAAANTTQSCGTDEATGAATKNTGIYWVRSWTGSGSGIAVDSPRATWGQSLPPQPPPRIGPSQAWNPQQQN